MTVRFDEWWGEDVKRYSPKVPAKLLDQWSKWRRWNRGMLASASMLRRLELDGERAALELEAYKRDWLAPAAAPDGMRPYGFTVPVRLLNQFNECFGLGSGRNPQRADQVGAAMSGLLAANHGHWSETLQSHVPAVWDAYDRMRQWVDEREFVAAIVRIWHQAGEEPPKLHLRGLAPSEPDWHKLPNSREYQAHYKVGPFFFPRRRNVRRDDDDEGEEWKAGAA